LGVGVRRNQMVAEPKQADHKIRTKRERKRDEGALDEALQNTFPASDPVSIEQPVQAAGNVERTD
jgi:hypothetical protein